MDDDKATGALGGRAVELRMVGFGYAMDAQEVMEKTGSAFKASLELLAASAHWTDTGERVFADVAAIRAWPMSDHADIVTLAGQASVLCWGIPTATPNGADASAEPKVPAPSH